MWGMGVDFLFCDGDSVILWFVPWVDPCYLILQNLNDFVQENIFFGGKWIQKWDLWFVICYLLFGFLGMLHYLGIISLSLQNNTRIVLLSEKMLFSMAFGIFKYLSSAINIYNKANMRRMSFYNLMLMRLLENTNSQNCHSGHDIMKCRVW
jgi:hypothetical protein